MPPDDRDLPTIDGAERRTFGDSVEPDVDSQRATISADGEPAVDVFRSRPFAAGFEVGRYVVLERVGSGAMGDVYSAFDPELDRRVALKMLRPERRASTERRARLLREAQSIAKLSHPNVIAVYDVGEVGKQLYLAMEFADGGTLTRWLIERRNWRDVLDRLCAAGRGLASAHAAGIVHRDFKPDNVLLSSDGTVKVADFGIARWAGGATGSGPSAQGISAERARSIEHALRSSPEVMTRTGDLMGTPLYMAPEQHGLGSGDARSDQFAFCVTAWEALLGERPYRGSTVAALMTAKLEERIESPPDCDVPGWVLRALRRGLAANPSERWSSMDALVDALSDDPRRRRRRWLGLAGVLAVGAVLGALPDWTHREVADDPCPPSAEALAEVWSDARRGDVVAAIEATKLPWASRVAHSSTEALDDYATQWAQARDEACRATWVEHSQPADVLAARYECLDYARTQLSSTVDWLEDATPERVTKAISAVASIPPVSVCEDPSSLREFLEFPSDPETRRRARELRDDVSAFTDRMRTLDAEARVAELDRLVARAGDLGLEMMRARLRLRAAGEAERRGDLDTARTIHVDTMWSSIARGDDETATRAAIELVWIEGYLEGDAERGAQRQQAARALLERMGDPPELTAAFLSRSGAFEFARGDTDAAIANYEKALKVARVDSLSTRLSVMDLKFNIASLMLEKGAIEDALRRYDEIEAAWVEIVGPDHPELVSLAANRTSALRYTGDFEAAIGSGLRGRALCGVEGARGPAAQCADVETALGNAFHDAQRFEEAAAALRASYRRRAAIHGPDNHNALRMEMHLVRYLIDAGDLEGAARQAAAERGTEDVAQWATAVLAAYVALAQGDAAAALAALPELPGVEDLAEIEPNQLTVMQQEALLLKGRILLELGRRADAIALLRAALPHAAQVDTRVGIVLTFARTQASGSSEEVEEGKAWVGDLRDELARVGRRDELVRIDRLRKELGWAP